MNSVARQPEATAKRIAITVDFESLSDTFPFQKLDEKIEYAQYDREGITRLLGLFEAHNVKSTFFVVARHAEVLEDLLRDIRDRGHEIASHTVTHVRLVTATGPEVEWQIAESKRILERIAEDDVKGFRSPAFHISAEDAT